MTRDIVALATITRVALGQAETTPPRGGSRVARVFQRVRITVRNNSSDTTLFLLPAHPEVDFDVGAQRAELAFLPRAQPGFHAREPVNLALAPGANADLAAELPYALHVYELGKNPVHLDLSRWEQLRLRVALQAVPFRIEESRAAPDILEITVGRSETQTTDQKG